MNYINDEYVVYVNHPNNKAVVHTTICGKFVSRRRDRTLNGYWSIIEHKPFKAIKEAQEYARKTSKKNIDTCAFCIRE